MNVNDAKEGLAAASAKLTEMQQTIEKQNRRIEELSASPRERALYVRRDGSIEWDEPHAGPSGPMRVVYRTRPLMPPMAAREDTPSTPPVRDERFHLVAQCKRTFVYVEV